MLNAMLEVEIDAQAYGGEALGRAPDGRRVFVGGALSGERVRIRVIEDRRSYLRGQVAEVLRAAEERIAPRCVHFGECGGCHYQHMHYPAQVAAKAHILREQLQRLGGIDSPPIAAPLASPAEWNYRNHLQFSLAREGRLGFMRPASRQVLVIRECHLPEPPLDEIWPRLDLRQSHGLHQVGLRHDTHGEVMVVLEGGAAAIPEVELDRSLSVAWLGPSREAQVLAGEAALHFTVSGQEFEVSPGSFFQVNTQQVARLVEQVMALAEIRPGDTVLDLYSGVGLFSAFMAAAGARVIAVEDSSSSAADFEVNLDKYEGVELYEASTEQVLPQLSVAPQTVVLDPPRAGVDREAMPGLLHLAPSRVVYVSCDPSTLARDGRALEAAGYDVATVIPIDLFPQTYHIESVSLWRHA
jgi:23S rRNA (uracil1939-C5)-methyltransferase